MDINSIRLLFDTGLLVLIWIVQLLVYPSFLFYDKSNLFKWHAHYSLRLSFIVIPLMFGQIIATGVQIFPLPTTASIISLFLVISVWILTFLQFVPIHKKIAQNKASEVLLKQLVKRNWVRTILWTLIFCWSIFNHLH